MSLKQLLQILRARAGLVLFITCVVLGGVTAVTLSLPKRYEAEAGVLVNPMGTSRLGDTDSPGSRDDPTATQADIISGYGVALRVVGSLGLTRRPEAIRLVTGAGPLRNLQVLLSHVLPGRAPRRPESLDDWLATQLLKKLQVRSNTGSRVVKVAYSSTDPAFAAEVANAFVQAYLRNTAQVGTEPAERTAKLFDQQLASLRQRLQEAEEHVSDYERKSHLVSDGQGIDAETTRLSDLSSELVRVQSREYEARAKQRRLERFIGNGAPESDAPPEVLESPAVQESRQQVVQAQADLSALSRRVGPNHPLFVGAEAKLRRARAAYRQQMLAVARGLMASSGSAGEEAAALRNTVRQQREKVLGLKNAYAQLSVLRSEADNARKAYDAAAQRLAQTRIQGDAAQNATAVLLYAAAPPLRPASPKLELILGGGLLAGVALGVGAALGAETADRRVRSPLDIDELLGLPVLVVMRRRSRLARAGARLRGPDMPRLTR